jgi:hypothetical protein
MCRHRARYFAFARGDLTAVRMVERITTHLDSIVELAATPGHMSTISTPTG